jgi:hypothetical protein
MRRAFIVPATAAMAAAALLLGACRDDNEVIFYEPHVYKGSSDPALSQATVSELEARAQQGGRL